MNWFLQNWDKILGGVVGFFSSLLTMEWRLSDLRDRITTLEGGGKILNQALHERWNAASKTLDSLVERSRKLNDTTIPNLEMDIQNLEDRMSLSSKKLDRVAKIPEKTLTAVEYLNQSPNVDPINALAETQKKEFQSIKEAMAREVRTKRLLLLDEAETLRIDLWAEGTQAQLFMYDEAKVLRTELRANQGGAFLQFTSGSDSRRLEFSNGKGVNTIANAR